MRFSPPDSCRLPSMDRLLHLPFGEINYHPDIATLEVRWHTSPNSDQLRHLLQVALRLASPLQVRTWISDLAVFGVPTPADLLWLYQEWLPHLALLGVQSMGVVLPPLSILRDTIQSALATSLLGTPTLRMELFTTVEDARQWAEQRP
ncbi:hypothetical protein EJV47_24640 [Hymenobacter gummosus]|uniref:STAS/SEC14 domain-containing protein n=1 Tax=Hymenobacter gummosus TaxID=1776032 RepID=A0A431TVI4_9BACT|nr:hypothetical protein [Hymenobacter gummosus]RTQ45677.1 hypothetical protein EJV47_24640 [Hymenobacter gummosus]